MKLVNKKKEFVNLSYENLLNLALFIEDFFDNPFRGAAKVLDLSFLRIILHSIS